MALDAGVESLLNSLGPIGLQKVIDMAYVEIFRNYCIHNLNWFKGNVKAHSIQHKMEKTWMRFYIDHGRMPKNINIMDVLNENLTQESIERALLEIYESYKSEWDFDIMNPNRDVKVNRLKLKNL